LSYLYTQPIAGSHCVYAQGSVTHLLLRLWYDEKVDAMPPKALVVIILRATTLQDKDTSMVENESIKDSQVVIIKQLREIVDYMNNNTQVLDNKVNEIGMTKVKLLSIERFNSIRLKLKGFLL